MVKAIMYGRFSAAVTAARALKIPIRNCLVINDSTYSASFGLSPDIPVYFVYGAYYEYNYSDDLRASERLVNLYKNIQVREMLHSRFNNVKEFNCY